jgi:hypothetical protein
MYFVLSLNRQHDFITCSGRMYQLRDILVIISHNQTFFTQTGGHHLKCKLFSFKWPLECFTLSNILIKTPAHILLNLTTSR